MFSQRTQTFSSLAFDFTPKRKGPPNSTALEFFVNELLFEHQNDEVK